MFKCAACKRVIEDKKPWVQYPDCDTLTYCRQCTGVRADVFAETGYQMVLAFLLQCTPRPRGAYSRIPKEDKELYHRCGRLRLDPDDPTYPEVHAAIEDLLLKNRVFMVPFRDSDGEGDDTEYYHPDAIYRQHFYNHIGEWCVVCAITAAGVFACFHNIDLGDEVAHPFDNPSRELYWICEAVIDDMTEMLFPDAPISLLP